MWAVLAEEIKAKVYINQDNSVISVSVLQHCEATIFFLHEILWHHL